MEKPKLESLESAEVIKGPESPETTEQKEKIDTGETDAEIQEKKNNDNEKAEEGLSAARKGLEAQAGFSKDPSEKPINREAVVNEAAGVMSSQEAWGTLQNENSPYANKLAAERALEKSGISKGEIKRSKMSEADLVKAYENRSVFTKIGDKISDIFNRR